ncbi:MAG: aldo/keto reductase [Eubacteriales bacterium]|nr:aldo/keto reductase [Eubacteriales bacterium]
MNPFFSDIHKNFGFGFMRLPMVEGRVDIPQVTAMVDEFLARGFNYFDTAHGYLDGKSELALRECLTSRYPRDRYILTDKLSGHFFETREEIVPLFEKQLAACGVDYFDFYLMHAMSHDRYVRFKELGVPEVLQALKDQGKIRHIGMSFHDTAAVLDEILTDCPAIEVVQIQFNYLDFEDEKVQSRACYEVCRRHGKPVLVMEPVKGGSLVNLPQAGQRVFDRLGGSSNASYAIRFAAGFEGMMMVLSGMSTLEQLRDNVSFMEDFQPLAPREMEAVETVRAIIRNQGLIGCTGCRYCTEVCPQGIPIPELFAGVNEKRNGGSPADAAAFECLKCGKCEEICPQKLNIRELLVVAEQELG